MRDATALVLLPFLLSACGSREAASPSGPGAPAAPVAAPATRPEATPEPTPAEPVSPAEPKPTWRALGQGQVHIIEGLPEPHSGLEPRWEDIDLPWQKFHDLLVATESISGGTRQGYRAVLEPREPTLGRDDYPRAFRRAGAVPLWKPAWWHLSEDAVVLVVPYSLFGPHGGLGAGFYGPAEGGVRYIAHFDDEGENGGGCPPIDNLAHTDLAVRQIVGCLDEGSVLRTASLRDNALLIRERFLDPTY